jgi:hypothetical protein
MFVIYVANKRLIRIRSKDIFLCNGEAIAEMIVQRAITETSGGTGVSRIRIG